MADKTADADHFARDTRITRRGRKQHECLEANHALSGLNAGDVGPQHREVRGQL